MLDYRPDLESDDYRILSNAVNVIPLDGGYRTALGAVADNTYTTALTAACIGARAVKNDSGTVRAFFGSAAAIEEANGAGGWTDRSRGGGYTSGSNRWWFNQGISANEVIATNYADEMQVSTGAAFSNLTNAPKAKIVLTQSEALLALGYNDGTAYLNGIKISDRGASTTWTPAVSNEATNVILTQTPGNIVAGATLNDIVVVWKRRSMYVGRYVGGDDPWQFNMLHPYIGCLGQEAWAETPGGIIFAAENGVFIFDGSSPRQIDMGLTKTIRTMLRSANSYGGSAQMSHDEYLGCVYLWIPDAVATDRHVCFCYSYRDERWSMAYSVNSYTVPDTPAIAPWLGPTGITGGFVNIVRDFNLFDDIALGSAATGNGYSGHFVIAADDKKLYNLSGITANPVAGFKQWLRSKRFPLSQKITGNGTLSRLIPVWTSDGPPTSATMETGFYAYPGATSALTAPTTTMSNGRFDLSMSGNNAFVGIYGMDTACGIRDWVPIIAAEAGGL